MRIENKRIRYFKYVLSVFKFKKIYPVRNN